LEALDQRRAVAHLGLAMQDEARRAEHSL